MRAVVPTLITLAGLAISLVALTLEEPLLAASLLGIGQACDLADGSAARALGVASRAGAVADRTADAIVCYAAAAAIHPVIGLAVAVVMLPVQAWTEATDRRWSGRAASVCAYILYSMLSA